MLGFESHEWMKALNNTPATTDDMQTPRDRLSGNLMDDTSEPINRLTERARSKSGEDYRNPLRCPG